MKRYLSGSHVVVTPWITSKWGDENVGLQAETMRTVGQQLPNVVPRILHTSKRHYFMETLRPCEPKDWDIEKVVETMKPVWALPDNHDVSFSMEALISFLQKRDSPILPHLPNTSILENWYRRANEATHGDLTIENTLLAADGSYRFIDWMPYRHGFLPAHRDVDYGKLIQSSLGWPGMQRPFLGSVQEAGELMEKRLYSWIWACVHYERIRLRVTSTMEKELCCSIIEMILSMRKGR